MEVLRDHLVGRRVLGIYPLLSDDRTWFLAADCDGANSNEDALTILKAFRRSGLPAYLERSRSGQGMHVWVFFSEPVPARKIRDLAKLGIQKAGLPSFDRFFPSQDFHTGKRLGNLIALPLQRQARNDNNTEFLDPDSLQPFPDQWDFLQSIQRASPSQLEFALSQALDEGWYCPLPLVATAGADSTAIQAASPEAATRVEVTLREYVEIREPIPPRLQTFLKDQSIIPNPEWYRREARGLFLDRTPRFLHCGGRVDRAWLAPRGMWPEAMQFMAREGLEVKVEDRRTAPRADLEPWPFALTLRPDQAEVVERLMATEHAVLHATPGAGKTVMALATLARRAVPALILVFSKNLLGQWTRVIHETMGIPRRQIGKVIQGGEIRLGDKVTVATIQSLSRRNLEGGIGHWGAVVVDECHHIPAKTFAGVLRQLPARYLLGLTATPKRPDQLEPLIFLYLGPKVTAARAQELARLAVIVLPELRVQSTRLSDPGKTRFNELLDVIVKDADRTNLIVSDVVAAAQRGHLSLVLTDRKEHCDALADGLSGQVSVATLYGQVGKKQQQELFDAVQGRKVRVLIATSRLLAEGWDCPPLSALFLATPVSGEGRLQQMLGRLTRPESDKLDPVVYDYLDGNVPQLMAMFQKRLRFYRKELGNQRIPEQHRSKRAPRQGRATIDVASPGQPPKPPRRSQNSGGQLLLFEPGDP